MTKTAETTVTDRGGDGFSGRDTAADLRATRSPRRRIDPSRPAGHARRAEHVPDLAAEAEKAAAEVEAQRLQKLQEYAYDVEAVFNDISVVNAEDLTAAAGNFVDRPTADGGAVAETGVIDASQVQAADGRRIILSRNEYGDIVLAKMQEAAARLSTTENRVDHGYEFVKSAEAGEFMLNERKDIADKTAGYIEDVELARTVADREAIAREPYFDESGEVREQKRRAQVEVALAGFDMEQLKRVEAASLVGGKESDLVDPEVIKAKLVEVARKKVERANRKVEKIGDQIEGVKQAGNEEGNAVADEFLAARQQTSEAIAQFAVDRGELEIKNQGHISVEAVESLEASEAIFENFVEASGQMDKPFMERNSYDALSGIVVKELFYHTGESNQLVMETWNNATGKIIKSTLLKCENPTKATADSDSKKPLTMLRGDFRKLMGREPAREKLSAEAEAVLRSGVSTDNAPYEASGGPSGDYGRVAARHFKTNFARLHPTAEKPRRLTPRKRVTWYEKLFGRAR